MKKSHKKGKTTVKKTNLSKKATKSQKPEKKSHKKWQTSVKKTNFFKNVTESHKLVTKSDKLVKKCHKK